MGAGDWFGGVDWGSMNDWGEGGRILVWDACSWGEGSVFCGEYDGLCTF